MSNEARLKASKRDVIGKKVKVLREQGILPAVVYGTSLDAPYAIQMDFHQTSLALRTVSSSTLVTLDIDGEEQLAVIRDRQYDVLKDRLTHLDFLAVAMGESLRVSVSVRLVGVAPAIEAFEALILTENESLEIESLPKNLPSELVVDISVLENIGDSVLAKDLDLPEGVTIISDLDTPIVVAISSTRLEEEDEAGEEGEEGEEGAEPEVLTERPDDGEES